jgi:RNA polymerase sigma-70 factor (ECF subfamily)
MCGREYRSVGDPFADFFDAEFTPLQGYLVRRLGSMAAEDIAAEAFAIAYRHWDDSDPSRRSKPYLYGIAANLVRRHWREERRMLRAYARTGVDRGFEDPDGASADRLDSRARKQVLADALADLRRGDREILLLHAWAELSDREIAEAVGLPIGTVKSRLSRARAHLRNRLADNGHIGVESPVIPAEERH